jgi:tripartite-type tricarboxylate transporter receptor subunit TctC
MVERWANDKRGWEETMRLIATLIVLLACAIAGSPASAQDKYPSRTVKIVVPYGPGGATDIVARVLADQLKNKFGQAFIVENKPGGYGAIAIQELARSAPDGYTLMIGNVSTNAITPILFASKLALNYDKDVVPVMRLVDIPAFLVVTAKDFPPKTVAEFIDYTKKSPGKVNYGTVGVGSYPHYDMALFAKRAGDLDMAGIPNKAGASGVINDLLAGTVQVAFLNVASTAGNVKAGMLRALAQVNPTRLPQYPEVPTMAEAGFPGVGTAAWQALFAPAGTPPDVLEALRQAMAEALQAPSVVNTFKQQDFNIVPTGSLAEAKTWLAGEIENWRKITKEVKIEIPD